MDSSAIADRRQLRRKLGFWRVVAVLLLVALGFALYSFAAGDLPAIRGPQIARVKISGLIQDDTELLERLKKIQDSDQVKALIVSISSTGGTTYGGERIFKAIRAVAAKKPVVSDIRTVAASAGYMIATAGDDIVAGDTSITGSIGVIFQYPQAKDLLDKLGLSLDEIKSAPLKAEPSPFHPASEEAKAMIRSMVMDSYGWFVDLVADRRKLPREDVLKLADGSIFTGRQALQNKLVDTLGGEDEIRAYLDTRKVKKDLPIIDWKAQDKTSSFFWPSAASWLLNRLGYDDFVKGEDLQKIMTEKLFLDGLLSVWQGAAN
ncbi:signal peptide peptidase SppA [Rhizobium sp. LEGMi198b]|uniref:signal peptide peptidase SppA n=1 Tax=unclassified Rhizobium TaxID=2613769 RepID=UPI000CDF3502|nr:MULTISPECIES: signal peptide peptidase SppA [Rhizobium]AVA20120.1 signal peptide peptidase SppA-like protein [Rhizobium sp. NXC24]MDK4740759.1 signal peptide peptidase SppA [Rhizobium sp. CNPSo 3464]UWU21424.1 signal peptide peptidase SppA [Rhizobium tropici]WFU02224.1 signal peptide peptidase SppA [Rhizobium sp. CB3171]